MNVIRRLHAKPPDVVLRCFRSLRHFRFCFASPSPPLHLPTPPKLLQVNAQTQTSWDIAQLGSRIVCSLNTLSRARTGSEHDLECTEMKRPSSTVSVQILDLSPPFSFLFTSSNSSNSSTSSTSSYSPSCSPHPLLSLLLLILFTLFFSSSSAPFSSPHPLHPLLCTSPIFLPILFAL